MGRQPLLNVGVPVGVAVVEHHVQLPSGVSPRHALEEVEELGLAVPLVAAVGHPPGGELEGGERFVVPVRL
jgi:hypothetical protein